MLEPFQSVFLVVGVAILYLALTIIFDHYAAPRFRPQFARIFGYRHADIETSRRRTAVLLYPIRWYEQLLWPVWLPAVLVMRALKVPGLASRNRDADMRSR
ncbi:MAG: hypothetical protein V1745_01510 [Patescibacteria group bacterium]